MNKQKFVYIPVSLINFKPLIMEEIKALLEIFLGKKLELEMKENLILLNLPLHVGFQIALRASHLKYAGAIFETEEEFLSIIRLLSKYQNHETIFPSFHVRLIKTNGGKLHEKELRDHEKKEIGRIVKFVENLLPNAFINLREPSFIVDLIEYNAQKFKVVRLPLGRRRITKRDPQYRLFAPPATMDAQFSRLLVNIARTRPADVFLDPFCGSGSIVIEASLVGAYALGLDIHPKLIYGAQENSEYLDVESRFLIGDALKLPFGDSTIDAIATDPPYGRSASTFHREIRTLYEDFLEEASRVLRKSRFISICSPPVLFDIANLAEKFGFHVIFQHKIRVHKGLERLISVFRLS